MTTRITESAPRISETQLREVEQRLAIVLPDDYRAFLLAYNGGRPMPGWVRYSDDESEVADLTQFYSASEVETETTGLRKYRVPNFYVPIGAVSDEESVVLSLSKKDCGAVFWNASNDNFDRDNFIRLADSFGELFAKLDYVEATKPWMMLIDNNNLAGLTQWLDGGGSANAADDMVTSMSAIEHAALTGRLEMVALLLARGAKPRSAFLYAVQASHRDMARLLAPRGVTIPHAAEALVYDWVRNDTELAAILTGKPRQSS
jgi:hypothetical protein